jgi:pimeloyl-ACP methyl ester carboxylesterase
VRAAKHLPGLNLARRTVVWGHSQGGNAALWAGILAPSYAPDVDVVGVAAVAPTAHLLGVINPLKAVPGGTIFEAYMITAYTETYADVHFNQYVLPAARGIARTEASRCLDQKTIRESIVGSSVTKNIFISNPTSGAFGTRLSENSPTRHITAPLLVAQGGADALILPKVQARFVKQLCDSGQSLEYRTYAGQDHNGVIANDSPFSADVISWTQDRFAGKTQPSGCHTVSR